MREHERALATRIAIERAEGVPEPFAEAEARLREMLEHVTGLDGEIEALSAALDDFSRGWERALGGAFRELAAAERVVRRLRALEEGLLSLAERLGSGEALRPAPARRRPRLRPAEEPYAPALDEEPADAIEDVLPAEQALKRVYRRLARVLHPDLARDDPERDRLGALMARANAAYESGDLTALEVMAEKVGAGEPAGELGEEERRAHLEKRVASLARIAASLARERDRLARSDTHRLREEARQRAESGGDLVAESRAELADEAQAAWADASARLEQVEGAARALARARRVAMKELEKRGPAGARRAFDPLRESELVRLGAARLDRQRATTAARELARALESAADSDPAPVALTLLAFFAEDGGGRPPDALATARGWSERWDRLRAGWPGVPDLPRALGTLPRWLALGARAQGDAVVAGVQLADASLLAGVRLALEREAVARLARSVLSALGPDGECEACGASGPGLHLLRTRGLDELHGVVCPACGGVIRSYWRYGEVDGIEALSPHALRLGLVAEATARLGDTAVGFQMLPAEREQLTPERLRRRFGELYLAPYEIGLPASSITVSDGKGDLHGRARIGGSARLRLGVARGAAMTAEELLEVLRARIERRFRP